MKYVANPVEVDAYRIVLVTPVPGDGLKLDLDNTEQVFPTAEMMSRMTPKEGDYWVIQSDGYIYLNPKDVFERKYHLKS
jgi:hypothetical protein